MKFTAAVSRKPDEKTENVLAAGRVTFVRKLYVPAAGQELELELDVLVTPLHKLMDPSSSVLSS